MFRVGIIGCGRMANTIEDEQIARRRERPNRSGLELPYSHAAGYAAVEETQVVAACDIDAARLQAFVERWNVRAYEDFREMIERENLDIVSVATRPEQHAEQLIFAAENGVAGVYAEKPLCMTLTETDAIREAFERNGAHMEYGCIYRHWAAYEQARTIAESGDLGEVRAVLGFEGKALEGHFIDLLLYLLGDPEPVSVQGRISQLNPAEDDTAGMKFINDTPLLSALIEFDNGTFAPRGADGNRPGDRTGLQRREHPRRQRGGSDTVEAPGFRVGRARCRARRAGAAPQRHSAHHSRPGRGRRDRQAGAQEQPAGGDDQSGDRLRAVRIPFAGRNRGDSSRAESRPLGLELVAVGRPDRGRTKQPRPAIRRPSLACQYPEPFGPTDSLTGASKRILPFEAFEKYSSTFSLDPGKVRRISSTTARTSPGSSSRSSSRRA